MMALSSLFLFIQPKTVAHGMGLSKFSECFLTLINLKQKLSQWHAMKILLSSQSILTNPEFLRHALWMAMSWR